MNKQNLINGCFSYQGVTIMQHEGVKEVFVELFKQTTPVRILEIGTSYGGLTLLLRDTLDELGMNSTKLITWDIHPHGKKTVDGRRGPCIDSRIECRVENLFDYKDIVIVPEKRDEVASIIASEGTTIVMCDGAYKMREVTMLFPFLKSGDIIMAHDYHPDKTVFDSMSTEELQAKNLWGWCEVWDDNGGIFDHLAGTVGNLKVPDDVVFCMKPEFAAVAWVCMRKK